MSKCDDDDLQELPIAQLVPPWILLRSVNQDSVEYEELRDSLREEGFLNSIAVRPCKQREGFYEIIDGVHRWMCAKDIGLETVPAIIKYGVTDNDILSLQLQANAVRPETLPCDFARQLRRLQKANPEITIAAMSVMISKNPGWVSNLLGLLTLDNSTQKMVDRGEINLQNAYMLVKLPPRFRKDYIDQAKTMSSTQFAPLAAAVLKKYQEAVRQGKLDVFFTDDFEPQPYLRSIKRIQNEYQGREVGPLLVASEDCKTPLDGFYSALRWSLHLDLKSVEDQIEAARTRSRTQFFAD